MKKEENSLVLLIVTIVALFLLTHTLFTVVKEFREYTGKASAQTATVSLTITSNETITPNVTNETTVPTRAGRPGSPGNLLFAVEPQTFSLDIIAGETYTNTLRIKNTGDLTMIFSLKTNRAFLSLEKTSFSLRPGEEETISFTITPLKPGIVTAVLTVTTEFAEKQIPIIIDVQSPGAAFIVDFDIPSQFKVVKPGAELFSTVVISDLDGEFIDVTFVIMDAASTVLHQEQETLQVADSITIEKTMRIPSSLLPGSYAFGVIVQYRGETKTKAQLITLKQTPRSQPFTEQPRPVTSKKSLVLTIILIGVIILNYFFLRKKRKIRLSD